MKPTLALVLISFVVLGCESKQEVDVSKLSTSIIPYKVMSENQLKEMQMPEDQKAALQDSHKKSFDAYRSALAELISKKLSAEELRELNEIYTSEVVLKLQKILLSEELEVESKKLIKFSMEKKEEEKSE